MSESELRREPTQLENTIEWYCKRSIENYRAELKKKIEKMGSYEDGDYHDGRNDALTEIMQLIDQTTEI